MIVKNLSSESIALNCKTYRKDVIIDNGSVSIRKGVELVIMY